MPPDEYEALLEDLVTCYGCLEWYVCVCESVRFRQSRSSVERLFQPRQPRKSAARRCLVADYKRIHYPLYKINHDERERKKEGEKPRYERSERESSVAIDNIHS